MSFKVGNQAFNGVSNIDGLAACRVVVVFVMIMISNTSVSCYPAGCVLQIRTFVSMEYGSGRLLRSVRYGGSVKGESSFCFVPSMLAWPVHGGITGVFCFNINISHRFW